MIKGIIFGCFDLFHQGHYNALEQCKKHCDVLYVGVLKDDAVASYKRKPIWNENQRRNRLLEVPFVDDVILTDRKIILDKEMDVFFVSEDHKGKKLYCVPKHRYQDIIWIPYTKGISTTKIRDEKKYEKTQL